MITPASREDRRQTFAPKHTNTQYAHVDGTGDHFSAALLEPTVHQERTGPTDVVPIESDACTLNTQCSSSVSNVTT